jgi:hypothetical protein
VNTVRVDYDACGVFLFCIRGKNFAISKNLVYEIKSILFLLAAFIHSLKV